jgi:hypothetical protein
MYRITDRAACVPRAASLTLLLYSNALWWRPCATLSHDTPLFLSVASDLYVQPQCILDARPTQCVERTFCRESSEDSVTWNLQKLYELILARTARHNTWHPFLWHTYDKAIATFLIAFCFVQSMCELQEVQNIATLQCVQNKISISS